MEKHVAKADLRRFADKTKKKNVWDNNTRRKRKIRSEGHPREETVP